MFVTTFFDCNSTFNCQIQYRNKRKRLFDDNDKNNKREKRKMKTNNQIIAAIEQNEFNKIDDSTFVKSYPDYDLKITLSFDENDAAETYFAINDSLNVIEYPLVDEFAEFDSLHEILENSIEQIDFILDPENAELFDDENVKTVAAELKSIIEKILA